MNAMSSKSSKPNSSEGSQAGIVVGRIRKPHGIRGDVVIEVLSDVSGRFEPGSEIEVVEMTGERWRATIDRSSLQGKTARISLVGIEDRDAADSLRGATLQVSADQVPPAPDGSFFFFDLIWCECIDVRQGILGTVEEVVEDGGGLLLEVAGKGRALLIPFVGKYLRRVDTRERRIEVELPEGLADICTSKS